MRTILPVIFHGKLFLLLFSGFIAATIAGTILHECGHYSAGKLLGYEGQHMSYAYTTLGYSAIDSAIEETNKKYHAAITDKQPFPGEGSYNALAKKSNNNQFVFLTGGPLETILTGSIGLLFLFLFRKRSAQQEPLPLGFGQWLLVFLSLFWLRELFNFVCDIVLLINGQHKNNSDEFRIAQYLHWNGWLLSAVLALTGAVVLAVVVFIVIPPRQRFTFLTAGLTGGIAGAMLWLVLLGPKIMPVN